MVEWWNSLTALERCFAYVAIPATLVLAIQTVLLLIGLGGDSDGDADGSGGLDLDGDGIPDTMDTDLDLDLGGDGIPNMVQSTGAELDLDPNLPGHGAGDSGLRLFTIRGLVAFFSVFGWCGLAMLRSGAGAGISCLVSLAMGTAAMVILAAMMRAAMGLQSDGTLNLKNALGLCGSVYLTIPAARRQKGKVSLLVQDRLGEFDAVTDEQQPIPTGSEVVVVGISGKSTLVVCRK